MKNILYVSGTGDASGGEHSLLALMTHLDRETYCPIVVAPFEGTFTRQLAQEGIEVEIASVDSLTMNDSSRKLFSSATATLRRTNEIAGFLRRKKIDLVHVNAYRVGISYSMAARVLGIPVVWHDREFALSPQRQRIKSLLAHLLASRVITVSRAVAESYTVRGRIPHRVVPIHNGIAAERYLQFADRDAFKKRFGCEGVRLVGNIGVLTPWKGQHLFIEAARQVLTLVPDVKFIVAGDVLAFAYKFFEDSTEYKQQLGQCVQDYGLTDRVIFTGFERDIPSLFSALDLYVHCAVRPDPLPRVLLESMSSQVPIIAPAAGGVPEMIENGKSGVLYPPGDVAAVTGAIVRLLTNEQERTSLAKEAYSRVVKEFSIEKHACRVQKIYQDLLSCELHK